MCAAFSVIAEGTQPPMTAAAFIIVRAEPDAACMCIAACFHNAVCFFVSLVFPVDTCIPETLYGIAQFWNRQQIDKVVCIIAAVSMVMKFRYSAIYNLLLHNGFLFIDVKCCFIKVIVNPTAERTVLPRNRIKCFISLYIMEHLAVQTYICDTKQRFFIVLHYAPFDRFP